MRNRISILADYRWTDNSLAALRVATLYQSQGYDVLWLCPTRVALVGRLDSHWDRRVCHLQEDSYYRWLSSDLHIVFTDDPWLACQRDVPIDEEGAYFTDAPDEMTAILTSPIVVAGDAAAGRRHPHCPPFRPPLTKVYPGGSNCQSKFQENLTPISRVVWGSLLAARPVSLPAKRHDIAFQITSSAGRTFEKQALELLEACLVLHYSVACLLPRRLSRSGKRQLKRLQQQYPLSLVVPVLSSWRGWLRIMKASKQFVYLSAEPAEACVPVADARQLGLPVISLRSMAAKARETQVGYGVLPTTLVEETPQSRCVTIQRPAAGAYTELQSLIQQHAALTAADNHEIQQHAQETQRRFDRWWLHLAEKHC